MFSLPNTSFLRAGTILAIAVSLSQLTTAKIPVAQAQSPSSLNADSVSLSTAYITIANADTIPDGSLISLTDGQYQITNEAYSKDLFGVKTSSPAIELQPDPIPANAHPIVRNGEVNVLVNGEDGAIKSGDLITSSSTAGQAMKAGKSGFILGVAQADFSPTSAQDSALIPVLLDIKFAFADDAPESQRIVSRLMSVVSLSTISIVEEPIKSLRYVVAGLTILLTLTISFLSFGRVAYKGVEALGRNPLAKSSILTGIIINSVLGLGLALIGLATAYTIVTW